MSLTADNAPEHNGFRASDANGSAAVAALHPYAALTRARAEMFAAWRRWVALARPSEEDLRREIEGNGLALRRFAALAQDGGADHA